MKQKRWISYPNLNTKGMLFGGQMLSWIDEDASILVAEYVDDFVTAGMSLVKFIKPVKVGDILTFNYEIVHRSHTSVTVFANVISKKLKYHCVFTCYITFVCVKNGKPSEIGEVPVVECQHTEFFEQYKKFLKGAK